MNSDKKEFVMPAKSMLQTEEKSTSILVESGGEFVLPDYMPKVQKVLRLEARALPPTRYIGGSSADMSGSVLHTLIYLGEDGEISATVLPSKYDFSIPLKASSAAPKVTAAVDVDSVNHRLSAPRKINIRTRLRAQPKIFTSEDITLQSAGENGVHKLCCELDTVNTLILHSEDITLSESVDTGASDEAKLLWCGSSAAVSDVHVSDSGISVRGDVYVKVLLDEGGNAKMYVKKLPFDEFIDADISKAASAVAVAKVISTEAAKEQNGEVLIDVVLTIEAIADTPCKISAVKDVFCDAGEGKADYRTLQTFKHVLSRCGIYNTGGSVAKSTTGSDEVTSVLDASGTATLDEINVSSGKITAVGRCNINLVFSTADGMLSSADVTLPFNISQNVETPIGMEVSGSAVLSSIRPRVDGANVVFDMDIALCMRAFVCGKEIVVESMDFSAVKPYSKSNYPLGLVYPNGESFWALAKRNHVNPSALAKVNMIDIEPKDYANPEAIADVNLLMLELK